MKTLGQDARFIPGLWSWAQGNYKTLDRIGEEGQPPYGDKGDDSHLTVTLWTL